MTNQNTNHPSEVRPCSLCGTIGAHFCGGSKGLSNLPESHPSEVRPVKKYCLIINGKMATEMMSDTIAELPSYPGEQYVEVLITPVTQESKGEEVSADDECPECKTGYFIHTKNCSIGQMHEEHEYKLSQIQSLLESEQKKSEEYEEALEWLFLNPHFRSWPPDSIPELDKLTEELQSLQRPNEQRTKDLEAQINHLKEENAILKNVAKFKKMESALESISKNSMPKDWMAGMAKDALKEKEVRLSQLQRDYNIQSDFITTLRCEKEDLESQLSTANGCLSVAVEALNNIADWPIGSDCNATNSCVCVQKSREALARINSIKEGN